MKGGCGWGRPVHTSAPPGSPPPISPQPGWGKVGIEPGGGVRGGDGDPRDERPHPQFTRSSPTRGAGQGWGGLPGGRAGAEGTPPPSPAFHRFEHTPPPPGPGRGLHQLAHQRPAFGLIPSRCRHFRAAPRPRLGRCRPERALRRRSDVLNRGRIGMRSKEEPGTLPWQATRLPLLLVLLSLLPLVAVPIVIQNRVSAVREEINLIAEPALQEVDRIQLAIALETSATRGYL